MKRFVLITTILLLLGSFLIDGQQVRMYSTARATLAAPGYSTAVFCGGYNDLLWYFTIATINTSIVITIQAKKGESEWTGIYSDGATYTANGNYGIKYDGLALVDSVRFSFVSEAGGTDATITHNVALVGGI